MDIILGMISGKKGMIGRVSRSVGVINGRRINGILSIVL